jgi:hypothetical protein
MVSYLGTLVVDPASPAAKPGARKLPGYDPKPQYEKMMDDNTSAIESGHILCSILARMHYTDWSSLPFTVARIILSMTLAQKDAFKDYLTETSGCEIVDILGGRNK